MTFKRVTGTFLLLSISVLLTAAAQSWEGKTVILARPGVKLETPEGKNIAPKTSGAAQDLTFEILKEDKDRVLIDSRRQQGWIAKSDAIPLDEAVAYFTRELDRNPDNSHALTARGLALMSGKDSDKYSDKAFADFDRAIALDSKAILAYYHRANLAYGKTQYDKALADYNMVIALDPAFDWAYHVRGWIYYRRMDYDKALADYQKAIELAPTESVFYRDRGNIAVIRKEYDKALADYTRSIELEPTYSIPWQLRGRIWEFKKEYARALTDYEKAAELAGKESFYSGHHISLAMLLAACPDAKIRDGKKALKAAQKAYELAKGPNELAALAAAHAELGEFDEAVAWQTRAVEAAPKALTEQYQQRLKLYQEKKPYRRE